MAQQIARSRPAHSNGPTYAAYTPDGKRLVTVGFNAYARIFKHNSDAEPENLDDIHDNNYAVVATDESIITGSEDGVVAKYGLDFKDFERMLVRCSLPVRDLALSPDGEWVAVASDDTAVKIAHISSGDVVYARDQPKATKHISWRPKGEPMLTVSCTDGSIYVYDVRSKEAVLNKHLPALTKAYESDAEQTTAAVWHPDGRAFAVALPTRDIQVMSADDWEQQRLFKNGHTGDITAMAWSPNGALLATAGLDRTIQIWNAKTQKTLTAVNDIPGAVLSLTWHPRDNVLSYTCSTGELFIQTDIVPSAHQNLLKLPQQPAPFIHDPLSDISGNAQRRPNGVTPGKANGAESITDPLDDILNGDSDEDEGFIVDDDGQGYAEPVKLNGHKKRTNGHLGDIDSRLSKRRPAQDTWQPRMHPAVQPGSTPWRGSRRYLCINMVGSVETVDNYENGDDTKSHKITVDFWDQGLHRTYKLDDFRFWDKACLADHGVLFSCPPSDDEVTPAIIYYHPHETWTMNREEFTVMLPDGERVVALSLSSSYITAVTSANYVRIYTLYGVPHRVYRHKSSPAVSCASYRDYVLTVGNGSLTGSGRPQLTYTIENIKHDEVLQPGDVVALPEEGELKNMFFSEEGDPYIYDSTGTLLVLLHWRSLGQARWVPVLDTSLISDRQKHEKYWPVGVSMNKFYCLSLRGVDSPHHSQNHMLLDFDFQVPIHGKLSQPDEDDDATSVLNLRKFEESHVRESILYSLLEDSLPQDDRDRSSRQIQDLAAQVAKANTALLQLLNIEISGGEDRGPKALDIVNLLTDTTDGKFLGMARKIVERKQLGVLEGKIAALQEERAAAHEDWRIR